MAPVPRQVRYPTRAVGRRVLTPACESGILAAHRHARRLDPRLPILKRAASRFFSGGSPYRERAMSRGVYLLGVGLALVALGLAFTDWALRPSPGVTPENFGLLCKGMTE